MKSEELSHIISRSDLQPIWKAILKFLIEQRQKGYDISVCSFSYITKGTGYSDKTVRRHLKAMEQV